MRKNYLMLIAAVALTAHAEPAFGQLIVNGDFSAGNSGFTSGYNYIPPPGTGGPGSYTVNTNPQLFQPGLASFGDHTTGTGNMMIVDGSNLSTRIVWEQTVSVAPNTAYSVSAWAATTFANNPSVIHFEANGLSLGADLSLTTMTGVWQPFVATWNSTTNTSLTLRIFDANTDISVPGNDFALDDIGLTVVPEPTSMALVGVAFAAAIMRRGRKQSSATS